ncbi:hypothetical protein RW115_07325 [Macrococcus capreoli]
MNKLYTKDTTYVYLAKEAYKIHEKRKTLKTINSDHKMMNFKVVAFRQNKFNGLKMAGLSPLGPDGKVNTDELYIVYAGTDPKADYGAGHSLGGGLALLNAVMYNFDHARVFSAPNTFDLLPTDIKENYRSEKYDGKFYNYIHRTDLIGNSNLFAERIGTQIYAKDIKSDSFLSEINPIFGHFIQEFSFNGDSVHIKMDMYEMQKIADK